MGPVKEKESGILYDVPQLYVGRPNNRAVERGCKKLALKGFYLRKRL